MKSMEMQDTVIFLLIDLTDRGMCLTTGGILKKKNFNSLLIHFLLAAKLLLWIDAGSKM